MLKNSYNYFPITLPAVSDYTQVVAIRIATVDLVVTSIYVSPSIPNATFEEDIAKIFDSLRSFRKIVIGGDLNAHHYAWGNETTDKRGELLMNAINGSNLLLLNDGTRTFVPVQLNHRATAIDVTICTPTIYMDLTWRVLEFGIGSHHLAVETVVYTDVPRQNVHYVYDKKAINEDMAKLDGEDIQNVKDLLKTAKMVSKRHRRKDKKTPKFWWSDDVDKAWREKTEARREFNRTSNERTLLNFKKKAAIFQRAKRQEIAKKLEEFPNEVNPFTTSKELWTKIGRLTGKRSFRKENNLMWEEREIAEEFMDLHFGKPDCRPEESYGVAANYDLLDMETWQRILTRKKKHTAPGEDRITYEMLRQLSPAAASNIIADVNNMWKHGFVVEPMKIIKVVPIPKPGKDQHDVSGKRPISLVPTLTKVANTAVLEKLQNFIEEHDILPGTSFGFRKGMSTNTCLSYVVNCIKKNKRDGFVTALICIDLSNAFNAIKTDKLEEILCSYLVPNEINIWITGFLRNRRLVMQLREGSVSRVISDGLPQGDVLSPTLFNLYTVGLHTITEDGVELVQFADDFGIIVRAKNTSLLNEKVQEAVNLFSEKAEELNFKINTEKTKIILFTNNNNTLTVDLNGSPIETVKSHRYLGVTIDRYLSFGQHINETRAKLNDRLNMLKVICGIKNGSHPQAAVSIYTALIRSVIEYGCTVTYNAKRTNRRKLDVTNNQCLRRATGCTRTTPINALTAIAGQNCLEHRLEYVTGKTIARCFERRNVVAEQLVVTPEIDDENEGGYSYQEKIYRKNWNLYTNIMPHVSTTTGNVEINSTLEGIFGPKKDLPPVKLKQAALCVMNGKYAGRGRIFTDASKESMTCGIGIFVETINMKVFYRLEWNTSITSAELQALKVAMDIIEVNQLNHYVVFTDSMTACHMLAEAIDNKKAETLLVEIIKAAQKWKTTFQWIPSHVGISGNEMADKLARSGLQHTATVLSHNLFLKDVFGILKIQMEQQTASWYTTYSEEKGKDFYDIQPNILEKPWFIGKDLRGRDIRLLNRLLTGHNYAKFWLARMKVVESPECEWCEVDETAEHLILQCPRYGLVRMQFSFDCAYANLKEVFKTNNMILYEEIVTFVRQCKLDL